jgi:hypothetical protein
VAETRDGRALVFAHRAGPADYASLGKAGTILPHYEPPQCSADCDEQIHQLKKRLSGLEMEVARLIRLVDGVGVDLQLIDDIIGYDQ